MRRWRIIEATFAICLVALSGEILLRRWLWDQVPTQIDPVWVYALLVMNFAMLGWYAPQLQLGRAASKKTEKN